MRRIPLIMAGIAGILLVAGCHIADDSSPTIYSAGDSVTHCAGSTMFDMHYVPAGGPFIMGEHVESITQSVTLTRNFWMGETEVTQGLWEDVWGSSWPGTDPAGTIFGAGANYPVYYVNLFDIVAFCNLLTVADSSKADAEQVYYFDAGMTIAYTRANADSGDVFYVDWDKTGYRLPTEAEWEYAARYIDGTSWNHGNHVSGDTEYCCFDADGCSHDLASPYRVSEFAWWEGTPGCSKEVGLKTANALGLHDMSGNVWEWCYDWYALYSGIPETDPSGPGDGSDRVIRGGFWNNIQDVLSCGFRTYSHLLLREFSIGFRLCSTAD